MTKQVKEASSAADSKKPEEAVSADFRHLVRVSGVILNGDLDIVRALTHIKGIGARVAGSFIKGMGMDPKVKLGTLSEADVEKIEEGIKTLDKSLPAWMVNRQKDKYTGENMHLTGPDLDMSIREDINLQKSIRSYKGVRHSLGLPVRGQRTRTSFRSGATIGVARKKVAEAAASAKKESAATAKKEGTKEKK